MKNEVKISLDGDGQLNLPLYCPKCNGLLPFSPWAGTNDPIRCICRPVTVTIPADSVRTGWVCPICKSGISPYINKCPCMTIKSGGTGG